MPAVEWVQPRFIGAKPTTSLKVGEAQRNPLYGYRFVLTFHYFFNLFHKRLEKVLFFHCVDFFAFAKDDALLFR